VRERFGSLSKGENAVETRLAVGRPPAARHGRAVCAVVFVILLNSGAQSLRAQGSSAAPRKLLSAEKVVENYLKTIGGKTRVATIRDATYEWRIQLKDQMMGLAKTLTKTH
jgi:hypothetical protein